MARILGLGNPLLDLSVEVADLSLADKYGLKMGNACLAGPEHRPLYAEIVEKHADRLQYIAGGATLNSIRVAQWVSGQAPGYTAYVGAVSDDVFGSQMDASARADGVTPLFQVNAGNFTGTCAVVVYEKERSLCANLAAAETLTASHLETPAVAAAISSADIYYAAGFPLTHDGGFESVVRLGKAASAAGKIFATNISAPFIAQFFKDRLAAAVEHADFVFGNETEAAAWAEANGLGADAPVEAVARAIADLRKSSARPRTVLITQGSKATVIAEAGNEGTLSIPVEPIPAESIVDVNGAGDAFVGGFLAAISAGKPLEAAVKVGNWAAGHVIQHSGCVFEASVRCPLMA